VTARFHSLIARFDIGWALTSLAAEAFVVTVLLWRAELDALRALAVAAPAAVFIGAASRSARFVVRGHALVPARRVGTAMIVLSAGTVTAVLFAAGVQVARLVVVGSAVSDGDALLFAFAGGLAYLTGAAQQVVRGADEDAGRARADALVASLRAREAELGALNAKVNPHFLFNSLNSIAALTTRDPEGARKMCLDLAALLRERLAGDGRTMISLGEELETVGRYLAIEQVRFGERLGYRQEVTDRARSVPVPALVLQPLLENAIKHGISRRESGGLVVLSASERDGIMTLTVRSPIADEPRPQRSGYGQKLVSGRLEVMYRGRASLTTQEKDGEYVATVRLPVEGPEEP
jgi:two-component system sensor histidine kinase AlgZ